MTLNIQQDNYDISLTHKEGTRLGITERPDLTISKFALNHQTTQNVQILHDYILETRFIHKVITS